MATPADQRLLELLDKWLKSLELHLKYSPLDDTTYWQIQPWPEHQRPSRWIIDLALQKARALRKHVETRVQAEDATFSDSLELMIFLANLVGVEHIERFIPLADAANERVVNAAAATPDAPQPAGGDGTPDLATATATREMPRFVVDAPRPPAASGTAEVARTERNAAIPRAQAAGVVPTLTPEVPATSARAASLPSISPAIHEQVIADAARLVQWGRKWYELAELISGMADRPSLIDVRRILKDNKTIIDKRAGRG